MPTTLGILLGAAILIAGIVIYNRLVRSRNRVAGAWSDIDVQLQRRHDLVPLLVEAVGQYARYEQATLAAVAELRRQAERAESVDERGDIEQQLEQGMHALIAVAEDYPDLKASRNFLALQQELVETENYLQFARRYYNGSVRHFNTLVESVPSNLVARIFGFRLRQYFQKAADEVANVPLVRLGSVE
jgi:LemA protein